MVIQQVGDKEFDFFQNTIPSADIGDRWLDTSQNPPVKKVFIDSNNGGKFVVIQSDQLINQRLDETLSSAAVNLDFFGGYPISNAKFSGKIFSITRTNRPQGVEISNDGKRMYMLDNTSDVILEYDLTSPFNVNTASHNGVSLDVSGQTTAVFGIRFSEDGSRLYVVDDSSNNILQYNLSNPFDLSSGVSYSGNTLNVGNETSFPRGAAISNNGGTMFVVAQGQNTETARILEYNLPTNFELTNGSFTGTSFDISGQQSLIKDIVFSDNGNRVFVLASFRVAIFQYKLGNSFDLSTVSFNGVTYDSKRRIFPSGIAFSPKDKRMYLCLRGQGNTSIRQYSVGRVGPNL